MIRQLLSTMITPRAPRKYSPVTVAKFGDAAGPGAEAAALAGVGLDLYSGECTLAAYRSHSESKGYHNIVVTAITNRRTIVGGFSTAKGRRNDLHFSIVHDDLNWVERKKSFRENCVEFIGPTGAHKLPWTEVGADEDFPKLYRALLGTPAGSRGDPPTAAVSPGERDPTGALGAAQGLWSADAEAHAMLHAIGPAIERGVYSIEQGRDVAGRVVLLHRSRLAGPASYGTAFLSPLTADDFGNLLTQVLGRPSGYQQPQPGTHVLDFPIVPGRDPLSPAVKALGIAAFVGLGIGFSPGRMIAAEVVKKEPLRSIRVRYGDVPGGCSFELYGNHTRLERLEGQMAHALHQVLIRRAAPILRARVDHGWSLPDGQLAS